MMHTMGWPSLAHRFCLLELAFRAAQNPQPVLCRQVAGPPPGFPAAGGTSLGPPFPARALAAAGTSSATTTRGRGGLDAPGTLPRRGLFVRTSSRDSLAEAPSHVGPHAAAAVGGPEALCAAAVAASSDKNASERSSSCDTQRQSGALMFPRSYNS